MIKLEAAVMGTMKADVEFVPASNVEHMAMLEAYMRFNDNVAEMDVKDDYGNVIGTLKVNFINFQWEKFYGEDEEA